MERQEPENTYCYYSDLPSPMAYMEETVKENETEAEITHKKSLSAITLQSEGNPGGKALKNLSASEINRIIEMAWEDRTPFDAITFQFGISEEQVKRLMKKSSALVAISYGAKEWKLAKPNTVRSALRQLVALNAVDKNSFPLIKFRNVDFVAFKKPLESLLTITQLLKTDLCFLDILILVAASSLLYY